MRRAGVSDLLLFVGLLTAIAGALWSGIYGSRSSEYGGHEGPTPVQVQLCDSQSGPCSWGNQRYRRY